MAADEVEHVGEAVARDVLAHEHVLVAVPGEDLQLVVVAAERAQALVADDVRVREDLVVLARGEQDRRLDLARVGEVVVGQRGVLRVAHLVLDRPAARPQHLVDVAVVVHARRAVEVAAAPVRDVGEVLVAVERRPSGAPHEAQHVTARDVALAMEERHGLREELAAGQRRVVGPARVEVGEPEHVLDHGRGEAQLAARPAAAPAA